MPFVLQLLILLSLVVKMHLKRSYVREIVKNLNKVIVGKRYDFVANYKNGEYLVYYRLYEDMPWVLIIRIKEDKLNSNAEGWTYADEYNSPPYKNDPKHGNRFIRVM